MDEKKKADTLWRNRDFLKLWAGETVSFFGSRISLLALPLTAILLLDASAAEMGFLGALELSPFLLVTLFAGVWIDGHRRRPVLIAANFGRAVLLALIPLFSYLGMLTMMHLYVIGFLMGVLQVFFDVAYQSYLPFLVKREHLIEGNSKLQLSASVAEIGGPGLGGILIELLTAPITLLVDSASFLASVVGLSLIRSREPEPEKSADRPGLWRQVRQGMKIVLGNRYLLACASDATTFNMFNMAIAAVIVLYMSRELGMGADVIGVVFSSASVGALVGSISADRLGDRLGVGRSILFSTMVQCSSFFLIPLVTSNSYLSIGLLLVSHFFIGFGVAVSNIQIVSLRQTVTPDHLLGRMNASYRFFIYGSGPIGSLIGGGLGELIGLRPTLLLGAVGIQLAWVWLLLSPLPRLRLLTDAASPEPAAGPEPAWEPQAEQSAGGAKAALLE